MIFEIRLNYNFGPSSFPNPSFWSPWILTVTFDPPSFINWQFGPFSRLLTNNCN